MAKHTAQNNRCKFTLYNLAGQKIAYYLVDRVNLEERHAEIPVIEESLAADYSYQVFLCPSAKKITGTSGMLKICGISPEHQGVIYKYKRITKATYEQLKALPVMQNHESVYAFAKGNLAEGNLNTAKYAIASTFDATLTEKHAKALTNAAVADFAQNIDIALFYPELLQKHEIREGVKMNQQISLLALIKILEENRSSIILNFKQLQSNYRRQGIKRVNGIRDENSNIIKPWLQTEYIDKSDYVEMGKFEINRNTATINMLINRQVKLVKSEDKTPISELSGLLVNDLETFNNYTIVSEGELNVKSLQVKISHNKVFELLKKAGVLETVDKFDFRREYTIKLDNLPLVGLDKNFSSIDGLFWELAELKVLKSIISAHLKEKSDVFIPEQLDEFKKHYLSKNLYLNFPTTNEYIDITEALETGAIDSRVSYKIDIGSKDILNFGKFPSANKFLARMYEAYNWETGEIFLNPTFDLVWDENIAFRHKQLSSRLKITAVDEFMQLIFDDFIGLADNGKVTAILTKVGADILLSVLQDVWGGLIVIKDEMVTALTSASRKLEEYMERIYQDKISPLVFYIGATGLLPYEMDAKAFNADELLTKYPKLQVSKDEQEGIFFEVGDSIISVYAKLEYYSTKPLVSVSN